MSTLNSNLDKTDWNILTELQADARLSYAELGRRVGLSSPAVQERMRRLEDAGIIEGYHNSVNLKKLGLPIFAITRLTNLHGMETIQQVAQLANSTPEVTACYQVTGEDEYILHIRTQSMEHLTSVLHVFTPYAQCITSIVIRTPVNSRTISTENMSFLTEDES